MPDKKAFVPQDWPRLSNIDASMFFKKKYDAAENFETLKDRLVAGGDQQDRDISDQEVLMSLDKTLSEFLVILKSEYRSFVCSDGTMVVNALYGYIENCFSDRTFHIETLLSYLKRHLLHLFVH